MLGAKNFQAINCNISHKHFKEQNPLLNIGKLWASCMGGIKGMYKAEFCKSYIVAYITYIYEEPVS